MEISGKPLFFNGFEAFIVSDKGKAYRVGCRVTEEFCIAQGLKYTISQ